MLDPFYAGEWCRKLVDENNNNGRTRGGFWRDLTPSSLASNGVFSTPGSSRSRLLLRCLVTLGAPAMATARLAPGWQHPPLLFILSSHVHPSLHPFNISLLDSFSKHPAHNLLYHFTSRFCPTTPRHVRHVDLPPTNPSPSVHIRSARPLLDRPASRRFLCDDSTPPGGAYSQIETLPSACPYESPSRPTCDSPVSDAIRSRDVLEAHKSKPSHRILHRRPRSCQTQENSRSSHRALTTSPLRNCDPSTMASTTPVALISRSHTPGSQELNHFFTATIPPNTLMAPVSSHHRLMYATQAGPHDSVAGSWVTNDLLGGVFDLGPVPAAQEQHLSHGNLGLSEPWWQFIQPQHLEADKTGTALMGPELAEALYLLENHQFY
jgi:hypothetical protein